MKKQLVVAASLPFFVWYLFNKGLMRIRSRYFQHRLSGSN